MFGLRFDQSEVTEQVERFVLHGHVPSFLGAASLVPAHLVHDVLPCPLGEIRVAVLQINLGDLQIDRGLLAGFVKGVEETLGFFAVGGIEAVLFLRNGVEGVVDSVFASENSVALFHGSFLLSSLPQLRSDRLGASGGLVFV